MSLKYEPASEPLHISAMPSVERRGFTVQFFVSVGGLRFSLFLARLGTAGGELQEAAGRAGRGGAQVLNPRI